MYFLRCSLQFTLNVRSSQGLVPVMHETSTWRFQVEKFETPHAVIRPPNLPFYGLVYPSQHLQRKSIQRIQPGKKEWRVIMLQSYMPRQLARHTASRVVSVHHRNTRTALCPMHVYSCGDQLRHITQYPLNLENLGVLIVTNSIEKLESKLEMDQHLSAQRQGSTASQY
jgi:hypothetical protein